MKELKAALFDLDGTLCDTESQYSIYWGETGKKYRPDIPHFDQVIKGTTLTQILGKYFPEPTVSKKVEDGIAEWETRMDYRFYPGAIDFVKDLKAHGVKCAIVTSSNKLKMDNVYKQHPDLDQLFDRILTAEDFKASKPDPDCYLLGAKIFGCELDECVVFEDAINGLKAGMAAGIFTIGLATTNEPATIKEYCNHLLDSLEGQTYESIQAIRTQKR